MYFENKMAELFYEPSFKIIADAQSNVLVGTTLPVALCSYYNNTITLVNICLCVFIYSTTAGPDVVVSASILGYMEQ